MTIPAQTYVDDAVKARLDAITTELEWERARLRDADNVRMNALHRIDEFEAEARDLTAFLHWWAQR
jgi:hypothetical protein